VDMAHFQRPSRHPKRQHVLVDPTSSSFRMLLLTVRIWPVRKKRQLAMRQ
jgi:hypothetical protein